MRLILLTFLVCLGTLVSAQSDRIYFENRVVERTVATGVGDVVARGRIVNPSNDDLRLRWIREVNDLPQAWSSTVCDTIACQPARLDSADFTLRAGESAPINPRIYAVDGRGNAQITVRVVDIDNRSNNAVATFAFTSPKLSDFYSSSNVVRLYPNPGYAEFRVSSAEPVVNLTLTNMLGKVVRKFSGQQEVYHVNDLPNGIYLATLYGARGNVIKTLRYNKRQAMP